MKFILSLFLTTIIGSLALADDVMICFEAEDTTTIKKPVTVAEISKKEASGGKIIEIKQGAGEGSKVGGETTYEINLPNDGQYILWARVWYLDCCGNSFSVSFNNGLVFIFGNDRTYKSWHWVKSKVKLKLKKGKNLLKIANREDGIKIDQFIITNDRQVVPVDIEKSSKLKK